MWTSRILRCHAQQAGWTAVVDTSKLSARLGEILSSSPRQSTFDLRPTLFRSAAQCVPHVQRLLRSHLACSAQQSQCPAADGHSRPVLAPGAARRSSSKFLTVRLHRSSRAVPLVSVRRYPPVRDALQGKVFKCASGGSSSPRSRQARCWLARRRLLWQPPLLPLPTSSTTLTVRRTSFTTPDSMSGTFNR